MLSLQKNDFFLSFHSFILHSKIHRHRGIFFERGWGNSLRQAYVKGGGRVKHVKLTGMKKGAAGQFSREKYRVPTKSRENEKQW